jgi:uncharacterized protein with HEPN domain
MRRESAYVRDALRAIDELQDFVWQTSRERFLASPPEQSYVFHRLVIFGEAINRLAGSFQERYPALPWAQVIALRNRLVHAYFDLDMELVWGIASSRLDELRRELKRILETEFPGEE